MLRRVDSLSDEERAELERMTGKERVMHEADRRVAVIIGRRKRAFATVAMVVLAATSLLVLQPGGVNTTSEGEQVVAEAHEPAIVAPMDEPTFVVSDEPQGHEYVASKQVPSTRTRVETTEKSVDWVVPEVKCNSVCDADSVISEIWQFLSA